MEDISAQARQKLYGSSDISSIIMDIYPVFERTIHNNTETNIKTRLKNLEY